MTASNSDEAKSERTRAVEVRSSDHPEYPDGTLDLYDDNIGVFAKISPSDSGEWRLYVRESWPFKYSPTKKCYLSKESALEAGRIYLDTLPSPGTPEFEKLKERVVKSQ